ncbi:phospholipase D family protein [Gordonia tangerina]|jgi:hypothetical protein|uniref:Phospholipase D family protein n=1 Tax=Gordonia tangerina TaxID=2911060 RepID=A0ABS9DCN1_9ACTN|nr:phospholipase D family protein [Gordonia tangerina]MCF3936970.1 phospholipase D family protein [Gordonia tangerina]
MLPPDSRTTLLKQLVPPPGFTFDHLVATTFTLDLESALLPSLALAGSANVDGADRVETMAAIRASIAKIDIFHQGGQIAVPRDRAPLFSLLEDSIHAIVRPRGLFHPKIWLGVYSNDDGEQSVRLIVLSRNLTKDRSWDVALSLDGWIVSSPSASNKPIAGLLRYVAAAAGRSLTAQRRDRMTDLADTIRYAEWDLPPDANDLTFHVFGLPGKAAPKPDFSGYRHLLVSPFVQDKGMERLAAAARDSLTVVSRQESLDCLSSEWADWISQAYVLSPTAGIPDDDDDAARRGSLFTGLHAKLYAIERAKLAHIFVGSANATRAAFDDNAEILVELTGKVKTYGVDALIGTDGFASILEATDIEPGAEPEDDPQFALDSYLRTVAAIPLTAHLTVDANDEAQLTITSDENLPPATDDVAVSLSLLTDASTATPLTPATRVDVTYSGLRLSDVTAFMVITADDGHGTRSATVVKAHLIGDIGRRLDHIIINEINNPDAFRRLLSLLLAFGSPADDDAGVGGSGAGLNGRWSQLEQGLFEQILKASVAQRDVLDQLAGVVTSIIDNGDRHGVLPEGFEHLWNAISTATEVKSGASV